jgi:hypothetical protein
VISENPVRTKLSFLPRLVQQLLNAPRFSALDHTEFRMRRTRRHTRYLLSRPWEGLLGISGDVAVELHDEVRRELWVVSVLPAHPEELLTLDLSGDERRSLTVRVVESGPVVHVDGSIRHRLRLAIVE